MYKIYKKDIFYFIKKKWLCLWIYLRPLASLCAFASQVFWFRDCMLRSTILNLNSKKIKKTKLKLKIEKERARLTCPVFNILDIEYKYGT